jgi:hypothetical protein
VFLAGQINASSNPFRLTKKVAITLRSTIRVLPGPRTLTFAEISPISTSNAELAGLFARVCLCNGFAEPSAPLRGLCLCRRNCVSRKERLWFEETQFGYVAIEWKGRVSGAGGTIQPAVCESGDAHAVGKAHFSIRERLHDFVLFIANAGLRSDEALRLEDRDVSIVADA